MVDLRLIDLFKEGWSIIYTDLVPNGWDGLTRCNTKQIFLNTWDILTHEIDHAINDCPLALEKMITGSFLDFVKI